MAIGNIFEIPVKTEISTSLSGISFALCGDAKSGKSTFAAQFPKPIFLQTEEGAAAIVGITPVPISTYGDFKSVVNQLCGPQGKENFSTVVIDSITNLLLITDRYYAPKASELAGSKDAMGQTIALEMASYAPYGKGMTLIKNGIANQLQRLTNAGFTLVNIVHVEEKTNFDTGKTYIGPTISASLNNLVGRFVDQTLYLTGKGGVDHKIHFNPKGGYEGAGGRFPFAVDNIPTNFAEFEKQFKIAATNAATQQGGKITETQTTQSKPVLEVAEYDYLALKTEWQTLTKKVIEDNPDNREKISLIVAQELGSGKKASEIQPEHVENLNNLVNTLKKEFIL